MANESLFTTQTPANTNQFDNASEVVGTTITFAQDGVVRGIRFRMPATATGTFEGALYQCTAADSSPAGTLLSEVATFTSITADAWNTVTFVVPVNVTAGVAYRPAVRTSQGRYCFTSTFFTSALTNGNITALQDNTSAPTSPSGNLRNGVFASSGTMIYPSSTFNQNCYFVDVVYEAFKAVQTIFTSQTPSTANGSDATPYTLGTYFTPDINCKAIAHRFRAPSTVSGVTFKGHLYSVTNNTSGTDLAVKTYGTVTASQWNAIAFDTPIDLTAGSYYCTAYYTSDRFVASTNFFTSAGVVNGHLTANQDTVPYDNGRIHINGEAFPEAGAASASCYFSDIVIEYTTASTTTVTSDLDVRWTVSTRLNSDLDVRWQVATRVTSDLDVRWTVSTRVTSDLDIRWTASSRIQSDLDVRWQVWTRVTSDIALAWTVAATVTSDLDLRWIVVARVTSDLTVKWVVLSDVVIVPDVIVDLSTPRVTVDLTVPRVTVDLS